METKISNVTTKMNVERVVNGYKFAGTVEVYNNAKAIKSISAKVTKEGETPVDPMNPNPGMKGMQWVYSVSRSVSDGTMCGSMRLPDGIEGELILAAGIEFEKSVEEVIKTTEFNNI